MGTLGVFVPGAPRRQLPALGAGSWPPVALLQAGLPGGERGGEGFWQDGWQSRLHARLSAAGLCLLAELTGDVGSGGRQQQGQGRSPHELGLRFVGLCCVSRTSRSK